jgi:Tfp pilus assembly protein PilF
MIRRWLGGGLQSAVLALLLAGCAPSVESLTGGLVPPWMPGPKAESDMPAAPAGDELPVGDQLRLYLDTARRTDQAGNDAAALEQYEHVLALDPNNLTAMRRLCCLYDRRGNREDFKKAEELYRKVAKARPNDADVWNDWGYSLYLRTDKENCKDNWTEAEKKLRQALKLNPQHARAHTNLGLVLGQLERYDEAFHEFRAAQMSEGEAHCDLAFIYATKGQFDDAKRECRAAYEKDPSNGKVRELMVALEQPPHLHEKEDAASRHGAERTSASRSDGGARAGKLSEAQIEAEHEWARRMVASGLAGDPAKPTEGPKPWQTSGPITMPSGSRWMPVNAGQAPSAQGPPAEPAPVGSPGTLTMD